MRHAPLLGHYDFPKIKTAAGHQHTHERETHGYFIGDHLRRRAHGPQQCVFRIRRPAAKNYAVDTKRCQREQVKQTRIDIGNHELRVQRDNRPGGKRRGDRQHRRDQKKKAIGIGRNNDLFEHQLERIGERLSPAHWPDAVRTDAVLHITDDFALEKGQQRDTNYQWQHHDDDLQDNDQ